MSKSGQVALEAMQERIEQEEIEERWEHPYRLRYTKGMDSPNSTKEPKKEQTKNDKPK